jgi:hypothetical protein
VLPDGISAFRAGFGPVLDPKSKLNRQKKGPKLTGPPKVKTPQAESLFGEQTQQ